MHYSVIVAVLLAAVASAAPSPRLQARDCDYVGMEPNTQINTLIVSRY